MVRRLELAMLVGLVALVAWWARPAGHDFRLRATFEPGSSGQQAWVVDTADAAGLSQAQVAYLDTQVQRVGFFELASEYVGDAGADGPSRTLEVWCDGRYHRVRAVRQSTYLGEDAQPFTEIWDRLVETARQDQRSRYWQRAAFVDCSLAGVGLGDPRRVVEDAWGKPASVKALDGDFEVLTYADREAVLGSSQSVLFLRGPELSAYGRTIRAGQPRAAMAAFLGEPNEATGDTLTFDTLVRADLDGDRLVEFRLGLHPAEYTPCDRAAF